MDQQTERMLRNDIRLRTAPFYLLFWLTVLSICGVGFIVVIAELM